MDSLHVFQCCDDSWWLQCQFSDPSMWLRMQALTIGPQQGRVWSCSSSLYNPNSWLTSFMKISLHKAPKWDNLCHLRHVDQNVLRSCIAGSPCVGGERSFTHWLPGSLILQVAGPQIPGSNTVSHKWVAVATYVLQWVKAYQTPKQFQLVSGRWSWADQSRRQGPPWAGSSPVMLPIT